MIDLIKKDILPHSSKTPESFQKSLTSILNKGSIHTATDVLTGSHAIAAQHNLSFLLLVGDDAVNLCFRENFARACFEALLQFSFISSKESNIGNILCSFYMCDVCVDALTMHVYIPIYGSYLLSRIS